MVFSARAFAATNSAPRLRLASDGRGRRAQTDAAAEEYVEAKQWKDEISRVESTRLAIVEAERRKRDAVRAERYDLADAIKKGDATRSARASARRRPESNLPRRNLERSNLPGTRTRPRWKTPRDRVVDASPPPPRTTPPRSVRARRRPPPRKPPKDASPPRVAADDPAPRRDDPPRLALRASRASYGDESRDGAAPSARSHPSIRSVNVSRSSSRKPACRLRRAWWTRIRPARVVRAHLHPRGVRVAGRPPTCGRWLAGADESSRARTRSAAFAAVANDDERARSTSSKNSLGVFSTTETEPRKVRRVPSRRSRTRSRRRRRSWRLSAGFVGGDAPNPRTRRLARPPPGHERWSRVSRRTRARRVRSRRRARPPSRPTSIDGARVPRGWRVTARRAR